MPLCKVLWPGKIVRQLVEKLAVLGFKPVGDDVLAADSSTL